MLRRAIHALRETGGAPAMRARVQRRLHSLGAAARTVGFFRMAIRICDAQSVLEASESVTAADLEALDGLLDELPLLMTKEDLPPLGLPRLDGTQQVAVCVLGDRALEELLRPARGASTAVASARFDDPSQVWAALHPVVPDVFVIDVDVPGARAFVAALIDDLRTELVPIVAVGRFDTRDEVAHYVALGVTRTFTKPAQGPALRAACIEAVEQRRGHTIRVEMRGGTLPPPPVRRTAEAAGVAMPAPSSPPAPVTSPTTFVGRRVVAGDDDPVVVWFLADHFRKMGCHVDEALSGQDTLARALDVQREVPDLVFADLAMRDLDGHALLRALRADPATRDVPVVLQSWKQDRLTEARAAGIDAALLVKSATPEEHAAKAVELLGPHAHLRARLRAGGQVHGTLDKVSVLRLLSMAQGTPRTLKITVKDDTFVHALTVMAGSLRKVTRTAPGGRTTEGARAIATALGVARGTFTIEDAPAIESPSYGIAFVTDAVRAGRALADAVRGAHLPNVAEMRFDEDIDHALRLLDGADEALARRLAGGASPRALLADGECDAARLESVLVSLCRQGFVTAVREESPLLAPGADARALLTATPMPAAAAATPATLATPATPPTPPPPPAVAETTLPLLLQRQRAILLAPPAIVVDIPLPAPVVVHPAPVPVPARTHVPVAAPMPAPSPIAPIPEVTDVEETRYAALPEPSISIPIAFEDPQFSRPIAPIAPAPAPAPVPSLSLSPAPPPAPPTLSAPIAPRVPMTLSPPPGPAGPTMLSLPLAFQERMPRAQDAFDVPIPFTHHHRDGDSPPPPMSVSSPPPPRPARRWQRAAFVAGVAAVAIFAGAAVRWTAASVRSSAADGTKTARPPSPPPQGLLEVSAAEGTAIQVDGTARGMGPKLSVSLSEGMHEVRTDGPNAKTRLVEIARGKVTHVDLAWKPAPVPPTR